MHSNKCSILLAIAVSIFPHKLIKHGSHSIHHTGKESKCPATKLDMGDQEKYTIRALAPKTFNLPLTSSAGVCWWQHASVLDSKPASTCPTWQIVSAAQLLVRANVWGFSVLWQGFSRAPCSIMLQYDGHCVCASAFVAFIVITSSWQYQVYFVPLDLAGSELNQPEGLPRLVVMPNVGCLIHTVRRLCEPFVSKINEVYTQECSKTRATFLAGKDSQHLSDTWYTVTVRHMRH